VPPGGMFHVVAVTGDGVRVTDVWGVGRSV
jgi:hypothetical protein